MAKDGNFVCSIGGIIIDKGLLCDGNRAPMMKAT
jgi:hypothetical protein